MNRIIKVVILVVVIVAAKRFVWPWLQQEFAGTKSAAVTSTSGDGGCARAAESASNVWGSGLARFVNPPYDLGDWSSFRGNVETQIASAEQICITCTGEKCADVRSALTDLRSLVRDLDNSIRTGAAPPGDIVQRQESIDRRIADAR